MAFTIKLNGTAHSVAVDGDTPLHRGRDQPDLTRPPHHQPTRDSGVTEPRRE